MNENTAKSLVTSLINAAYEAGMHHESTMKESWQKKAERVGDEIIRHLTNQSSGQDRECESCGVAIPIKETQCGNCGATYPRP